MSDTAHLVGTSLKFNANVIQKDIVSRTFKSLHRNCTNTIKTSSSVRNFLQIIQFPRCGTKVTRPPENQHLLSRFEAGPRGAARYNVAKLFKVFHLMFPLIGSGRIRAHNVKPNEVCACRSHSQTGRPETLSHSTDMM